MFDLLSVGNITIDQYFQGESLTFKDNRFQLAVGGKYFVDHFQESVGGGGANVAIGVQNLGARSIVLGKIGENDFAKLIYSKLEKAGIDTSLCQKEKEYLNLSVILLTALGERSVINYETPHQSLIKNLGDLKKLLIAKTVYLGNLPDVDLAERQTLLNFFHNNKCTNVINLGVKDCRRPLDEITEFLRNVNVLILNGHEWAELIKQEYQNISFKENVVKGLTFLQDKLVVVTDGEKGSYAYLADNQYYQEALPVERIIDTTGCGDGYTAGFIAEYLKTKNIASSMLSGAKYAAKILTKIGAN